MMWCADDAAIGGIIAAPGPSPGPRHRAMSDLRPCVSRSWRPGRATRAATHATGGPLETDAHGDSSTGAIPPPRREASTPGRGSPVSTLVAGTCEAAATLAELSSPRLRLLAAGWLSGFRSPRTRKACAGDLVGWDRWCVRHGFNPLRARRVQVDLYLSAVLDDGSAPASAARRLSSLSSFYRFLADHEEPGLAGANPFAAVRRPGFDRQHSETLGLNPSRGSGAARRGRSCPPQRPRNAALLRLLLHNALAGGRSAQCADLDDLGQHPGRATVHDTLTVRRKGGRRTRIALATGTPAPTRCASCSNGSERLAAEPQVPGNRRVERGGGYCPVMTPRARTGRPDRLSRTRRCGARTGLGHRLVCPGCSTGRGGCRRGRWRRVLAQPVDQVEQVRPVVPGLRGVSGWWGWGW